MLILLGFTGGCPCLQFFKQHIFMSSSQSLGSRNTFPWVWACTTFTPYTHCMYQFFGYKLYGDNIWITIILTGLSAFLWYTDCTWFCRDPIKPFWVCMSYMLESKLWRIHILHHTLVHEALIVQTLWLSI